MVLDVYNNILRGRGLVPVFMCAENYSQCNEVKKVFRNFEGWFTCP